MFSKKQEIERLNKLKEIIEVLDSVNNIKEISELTKIPTSTIQRYLNNEDLLKDFGLNENDINNIKNWLQKAKARGLSNGGKTSQERYKNSYSRLDNGKFSGINKRK